MIWWILGVYLSGAIASYLLAKYFFTMDGETWTQGRRATVIAASIALSWICAMASVSSILVFKGLAKIDFSKPARW